MYLVVYGYPRRFASSRPKHRLAQRASRLQCSRLTCARRAKCLGRRFRRSPATLADERPGRERARRAGRGAPRWRLGRAAARSSCRTKSLRMASSRSPSRRKGCCGSSSRSTGTPRLSTGARRAGGAAASGWGAPLQLRTPRQSPASVCWRSGVHRSRRPRN